MKEKRIKVLCAASGGIDSSVSAALLKKSGFDVSAAFFRAYPGCGRNKDCHGANRNFFIESEKQAAKTAEILGIPFYVFDFRKEFKKIIADKFLEDYKKGLTPNPCVVCNKEIKFGLFMKKAKKLGFDFIATGHYAKKVKDEKSRKYKIFSHKDKTKDQSYFLHKLGQRELNRILFPLEDYSKIQVKKLAQKLKLPALQSFESQEICFIPQGTESFLKARIKEKTGAIIDSQGKEIGKHKGLWLYTIGQRKGIGLPGGPYYVIGKDFEKNSLIVSKKIKDLEKKEIFLKNPKWVSGQEPKLPLKAKAKIRYGGALSSASLYKSKKGIFKAFFKSPQKAVAPGQFIVFYSAKTGKNNRELLGGGTII